MWVSLRSRFGTRARRGSASSPTTTSRSISDRSTGRPASGRAAWTASAVWASAPPTPPLARYPATVRVRPSRRLHVWASAWENSGSATGDSCEVPQEQVDQPGLDQQPALRGRLLDGRRQPLGAEPAEDEEALLHDPGQDRVGADLGHPVRPHRQHDLTGMTLQLPQQVLAVCRRRARRPPRPGRSTRTSQAGRATPRRGHDHARRSGPGRATVATTPAPTNDDFPTPDGPTTASTPRRARTASAAASSASRPKKKWASSGPYAASPGHGHSASATSALAGPLGSSSCRSTASSSRVISSPGSMPSSSRSVARQARSTSSASAWLPAR